jgi:glycosyltransferase involved in cell wall biosynthesis
LIVGGGTDERVNTTLRESPWLKNYVIFAGPASNEERVDYYNLGDVYVLPSKYEGFGIVFIESLACGVPVIASDGYGCREGLLNGELGIVVPPDDLQAIANAIELILDRKAPNSMFDKEYLRRKTLEIYGIETWNKRVENLINLLST